jgi:glycyl-tRNA synthetase alpha chain
MTEVEGSQYNFDQSNAQLLARHFEDCEHESLRMNKAGLVVPAYEFCLKCSHLFNLLDARGAISVTERTKYIARVRNLAKRSAEAFYRQREELGFPLLRSEK